MRSRAGRCISRTSPTTSSIGRTPRASRGRSRATGAAPRRLRARCARRRLIAVREDHRAGSPEARNTLVAIACEGAADPVELTAGHDFYAAPRLSPDGRRLAWLAWNHPSMPCLGTELWLADVAADGALVAPPPHRRRHRRVAGQPQWSPDGVLYVVSDRSGWWNLYRVEAHDALQALCPMNAEFGASAVGLRAEHVRLQRRERDHRDVHRAGREPARPHRPRQRPLDADRQRLHRHRRAARRRRDSLWSSAGSPTVPRQVVRIDLASGASAVLASSVDELPDAGLLCRLPQSDRVPERARAHRVCLLLSADATRTLPARQASCRR